MAHVLTTVGLTVLWLMKELVCVICLGLGLWFIQPKRSLINTMIGAALLKTAYNFL